MDFFQWSGVASAAQASANLSTSALGERAWKCRAASNYIWPDMRGNRRETRVHEEAGAIVGADLPVQTAACATNSDRPSHERLRDQDRHHVVSKPLEL